MKITTKIQKKKIVEWLLESRRKNMKIVKNTRVNEIA